MFCDLEKGYWVFFGGGRKKVDIPADPDPTPTAVAIDLEAQRKAEDLRRKLKSRAGREGTILTEGGLGTVDVGKSVILSGGI